MLVAHSSAAFGGVIEDLKTLITKAPDVLSKAAGIVNKAGPYLPTIMNVIEDPAMPLVMQRVQTLREITAGAPSTPSAPAPPGAPPGIGLRRAVPLIDAYIFYVRHPWAPWAIGAGVLAVLGGIGFGIGRATKKCRTGMGRSYRRRR